VDEDVAAAAPYREEKEAVASEHAHDSAHDQKDGEHSQDNAIDGAKDEVDDSQYLKRLIRFNQCRRRRG
jgi:hypothetical protein